MASQEVDADMRAIISEYLVEGNLEKFAMRVAQRHKELWSLPRWMRHPIHNLSPVSVSTPTLEQE